MKRRYSWRWAIGPSNATGKQLTGAGDACNRVQKAVERTVPFAFLVRSLMIIWYALACDPAASIGRRRRRCPWYRTKATTAPADMHAALRGELTDAPADGQPVTIRLAVRRSFCGNPDCATVTFAEQVDGLTSRRARQTPTAGADADGDRAGPGQRGELPGGFGFDALGPIP